jgi:hypothetical protein
MQQSKAVRRIITIAAAAAAAGDSSQEEARWLTLTRRDRQEWLLL